MLDPGLAAGKHALQLSERESPRGRVGTLQQRRRGQHDLFVVRGVIPVVHDMRNGFGAEPLRQECEPVGLPQAHDVSVVQDAACGLQEVGMQPGQVTHLPQVSIGEHHRRLVERPGNHELEVGLRELPEIDVREDVEKRRRFDGFAVAELDEFQPARGDQGKLVMDAQAAEPVVEVGPEVRVFRDALEFVQQEHHIQAPVVDFLEELVEIERIQPVRSLQGGQHIGNPGVRALPSHQHQEASPQLLRAHRLVHHLEIHVDKRVALELQAGRRPDTAIGQVVQ